MKSVSTMQGAVRRQMRRFAVATTLLPVLVVAVACSSSDSDRGDTEVVDSSAFPDNPAIGTPVKIGLINPEGGPTISMPDAGKAASAVVQYANANLGGIAGHNIELVTCASKEDPASTRDCANQMVEAGVAAVVVTQTAFGDSIAPLVTGAGIAYITPAGNSPAELTTPDAFSLNGGFPGTLNAMATYAASKGHKKVVAFMADAGTAVASARAIGEPAFAAKGVALEVVPIPLGAPDSTPQVSSGLSGDVDAIAIVGDGTTCTSVLKSLNNIGAEQERMLIQPCLDPATVEAVGEGMDGSALFTFSDLDSDNSEAVLYRSVMAKYAPGTEIGGLTVSGYVGMLGLVRAADGLVGDPTGAAIAAAVESAKDVVMPAGGGITFSCDGTALPGLPAICTAQALTAVVEGGAPTDPQLVK